MTDKEKLEICIKFIEQMKSFDSSNYDKFELDDVRVDVDGICNDCGSDDVDVEVDKSWPCGISLVDDYISTRVVDDIRDAAWHVWAEIQD